MNLRAAALVLAIALMAMPAMSDSKATILGFADLDGWADDDLGAAMGVFTNTCGDLNDPDWRAVCALARTRPGQLDFGSGSTGSTGHLAGELFKQMTGTFMVHIPYRSSAPAVADMLAGRVHLMFDNLASALPNIKAGKVRALAVTTTRRTDFLPDLPTLDESGLKGFNLTTWWGLMAPAKTPNEIVNRLSAETLKAMDAPDARERLRNLGSATPGVRTPEAFSAFIEAEKTLYARLVKVSGAKPD